MDHGGALAVARQGTLDRMVRFLRSTLVYAAVWSPVALGFAFALALTERLTWAHALAALAYSAVWSGAIVTEMSVSAPRAEVSAFLRLGLAWQLVTGVIVYAVLAGVTYARSALRYAEVNARAAERAETLRLRAEL